MGRVAVLLTEGFADWETAYILGVGCAFYGLSARTVSPGGAPIRSQGGLQVTPDGAFDAIDPGMTDVLVLCGGMGWAHPGALDVWAKSNAFLSRGKSVAAICGATLALARAGVLDGRRHTSNDRAFLAENAPGYAGSECYADSRMAVTDGLVITAPGSAPATFTAAVFRAAGLQETQVSEFLGMVGAEHGMPSEEH